MLPHDEHMARQPGEHLRAKVSETPVAQHHDMVGTRDRDLRWNLVRRGNRLGKHRHLVRERVGNGVQIGLRYRDLVGERAVVVEDAEHRAVRAVRLQAGLAGVAALACAVDLADDTTARQWARLRHAYELVAEHTAESHVALDQLQVGFAHARAQDPYEYFPRCGRGIRSGVLEDGLFFENDRAHEER